MKLKTKNKILRIVSTFLLVNILLEVVAPVASYALTSGPSQPEVQSFEPVGTTEMVDLFTGDFTYNIPLFELPGPNGGYPFNLHYNSGINMDQEASWVGLGWNLNPGAITRQMRGLPDEFNGAIIRKKMDMRPNVTFGVGVGADLEIFGGDLKEALDLSVSLSIYYNNYKGVGYSLGASLSASIIKGENGGMSSGLGFGLSLDSQQGVGANASISFKDNVGKSEMNYNVGIGYNSKSGLTSLSFSMDATSRQKLVNSKTRRRDGTFDKEKNDVKSSIGGSSSISLAGQGYVPSVSMPMRGRNINVQFKLGGTAYGVLANGMINGFFSTQYLKDAGRNVNFPAYGYLNMQNKNSERVMLDFNREKDGQIRENSPNLAIPATNPDIYSVTAQGIAGTYRAFRNDIGVLHDTEEMSNTAGGALGIEIGPGTGPEIGGDVTMNYSESRSGRWNTENNVKGIVDFKKTPESDALEATLFEAAYFKPYGEHTADPADELDFICKDQPVRMELGFNDATEEYKTTNRMVPKSGNPRVFEQPSESREPRNTVLKYIDNDPGKGMESVGSDGTRYIYGQLARNTKQVECIFATEAQATCGTVNIIKQGQEPKHDFTGTDHYFSRTEITEPFPYAYLLTAIVGPDYVDVDRDGKVSDVDAGYWVRFEYTAAPIDYKWRAPLRGATYMKGLRTTPEDDRGSYMYGEKEIYYLKSVFTKTHEAEFYVSDRKDGFGASNEIMREVSSNPLLNDPLGLSAAQKKLDKIELRLRNGYNTLVKAINFTYSYRLCRGVENNTESESSDPEKGGKLTLEKLEFFYGKSNRGRLSPYTFEYASGDENPVYKDKNQDRWGDYKKGVEVGCDKMDFPYVEQYDVTKTEEEFRSEADSDQSSWNLKKINLPTGGTIQVDYEADDYAYVQNKRAMQMFKMTGFTETDNGGNIDVSNSNRRIYFDLEKPIATGAGANDELDEYFDGMDKLYWNVFMFIRESTDNRNDYVSGYNDIEDWGFASAQPDGKYHRAWVSMKKSVTGTRKGSYKEHRYHPFSMAAWQYIRTQNPNLSGAGPFETDPNSSEAVAMDKVKSLVSIIPEFIRIFQGFNNYADSKGWGSKVVTDKSFIRLNSPDKIKIGGGCRVKKIVLKDNWKSSTGNAEEDSEYGQVYEYTLEENGRIISSGVASNEPQIGADENPLRKAKEYTEAIPLKTDNNLFFEYPINESYYPDASVGYRRVVVKSLATHYESVDTDPVTAGNQNAHNIPAGIMTTGATVHEFFTAKEFPVIVDETNIEIKPKKMNIPIPLIGHLGEQDITATQGYSIILNDMHGKLKKVSNYRQTKTGTIVFDDPISFVEYKYKHTTVRKNGNANNDYYKLDNLVDVITSDNGIDAVKGQKFIGQDYEFFTDMREMTSEAASGGLKINTDVLIIGPVTIPAFVPWPNVSYTSNTIRTAVTNKIIHRSGILMETVAYDAGSYLRTKNIYFDELTGQPILTSVSNDFDDPIYDYTVPAHFVYDGMGPAYKNIGLTFSSSFASITGGYEITLTAPSYAQIVPGDEFITSEGGKGVIVKKLSGNKVFATMCSTGDCDTGDKCTIIRSGRRNLLSANASNIKSLGSKTDFAEGNPVDNREY